MRVCLCILALAISLGAAPSPPAETLRGRLVIAAGHTPALVTADGTEVKLDGDPDTRKILDDPRLSGFEVDARGHFTSSDRFAIDPIHTRAILVHRDGKLMLITYFCELCNIRAWTPGPCACCQRETTLELRDPDEK
jgi:hypothetical protein